MDEGGPAQAEPEAGDLKNEDPEFVGVVKDTVLGTLQQYGWFILIGIAIIVYLYNRYRPQLEQWRDQREADSYKKMDEGVAYSRLEAMERARQRMQAQLDEQAKEFAEKQRQKEEEKRQARLEDWDRHQQGKGYRSKVRPCGMMCYCVIGSLLD
ncbi:hypothetical protein RRG08_062467 [Elysia crispata]|uniref:Selenoprotein S n=1 Tax=Elysia crispata TaxID=231223 RepID=A0AAE0XNS5_9GAST|nr:hypothetical protein RRG08_062467 [Elysia crispata]